MEVIPKLPQLYEEPFADASQIPTFLVSQLARRHVTVSLSGDGGDEVFGGYDRYFLVGRAWNIISRIHNSTSVLDSLVALVASRTFWRSLPWPRTNNPRAYAIKHRLAKIHELFSASNEQEFYHVAVSHWVNPSGIVLSFCEAPTVFTRSGQWPSLPDFGQRMMFVDMLSFLPDGLMVKVDRASMGVSLESRAPFLDHRLIEFAWTLPRNNEAAQRQG